MIVKITGLERGQRTTKKGDKQDGITVTGIKYKDGQAGDEWSRFFTDYFDGEIVAVLEQIGVGNMVDIKMEQNGKFWNPVSAKPAGNQAPSQGSSPQPKSSNPTPKSKPNKETDVPMDASFTREAALQRAVQLVGAAVVLNAQDKMGLFPKSKMTLDLLAEEVLSVADMFEKYLGGKVEGEPKADAKALTEGDGEKPGEIPEDDIPF